MNEGYRILHGFGDRRIPTFILRNGKAVFNSKVTAMKRFELGQIVATTAALDAIHDSGQTPAFFLDRHAAGDWGEVGQGDAALNDAALVNGERLVSAYRTLKGVKLWVITEAVGDDGNRECSTILLPSEY